MRAIINRQAEMRCMYDKVGGNHRFLPKKGLTVMYMSNLATILRVASRGEHFGDFLSFIA